MSQKNSEKPNQMPEQERAEMLQRMPPAFPAPPLDKEEDYIERMIRRDRETEYRKEQE